jgi:hypothetical protein
LLVAAQFKMIRSGSSGEKEGKRDRRGKGNTWEIRGECSGRWETQGGAELRNGNERYEPQELEVAGRWQGGDTRMCTEFEVRAIRLDWGAGCKRRQRDWRRRQRDGKGGEVQP